MAQYILPFLVGVFFFNGIPHFVRGICGKKHMTPFSRESSAPLNVIWGWVNFVAAYLLAQASGFIAWQMPQIVAFCIAGFITSLCLAIFWSNPNAKLPWHKG